MNYKKLQVNMTYHDIESHRELYKLVQRIPEHYLFTEEYNNNICTLTVRYPTDSKDILNNLYKITGVKVTQVLYL